MPDASPDDRSVVVVIPMPNDPDWGLWDDLSEDVPIIVVDDSGGNLTPPDRDNVRFFGEADQRALCGDHYAAMPHKSAASRNVGHYLAYKEGYDVIIALDYDCRTREGWLAAHLDSLTKAVEAPALEGHWINTITAPGFYSRGYPYEYRTPEASVVNETTATGEVKMNMGVWDNILDLNGVDKLAADPPYDPGLYGDTNVVALGNFPVCGMNTAFDAEITPAFFFLPDLWIDGWQLSRHDDIWGGYVIKKLMDVRGDLATFGRPIVEHTKQTRLERVVMLEHWMHLMATGFYECVDEAVATVTPGSYTEMFAAFVDEYDRQVSLSSRPAHYREVYRQLGDWMGRWSRAFA